VISLPILGRRLIDEDTVRGAARGVARHKEHPAVEDDQRIVERERFGGLRRLALTPITLGTIVLQRTRAKLVTAPADPGVQPGIGPHRHR